MPPLGACTCSGGACNGAGCASGRDAAEASRRSTIGDGALYWYFTPGASTRAVAGGVEVRVPEVGRHAAHDLPADCQRRRIAAAGQLLERLAVFDAEHLLLRERDAALTQQRTAGLARLAGAGDRVQRHRIAVGDLAQFERQFRLDGDRGGAGVERARLAVVRVRNAVGVGHLPVGADDLVLGFGRATRSPWPAAAAIRQRVAATNGRSERTCGLQARHQALESNPRPRRVQGGPAHCVTPLGLLRGPGARSRAQCPSALGGAAARRCAARGRERL